MVSRLDEWGIDRLERENERLRQVYDQLVGEKERYRRVIQDFANEANWTARPGCLQWTAKRNAIEYAQSALEPGTVVGPRAAPTPVTDSTR